MSARARVSALVAFLLLVVAGSLSGPDDRGLGATTHGTPGWGYGALYDFLAELDLPVERSFDAPEDLPRDATVWWLRPDDPCEKLATPEADDPWSDEWRIADFVREGGTAVLWLAGGTETCLLRAKLAGFPLPARWKEQAYQSWLDGRLGNGDEGAGVAAPDKRDPGAHFGSGLSGVDPDSLLDQWARGPLSPRARALVDLPLAHFLAARLYGWRVVAELDGSPFAIERRIGAGRAVVIADASFVRNEVFDRGDAAPFVVDLVRAYGVPRIDEREHGLSGAPPTFRYLAGSRAAPVFCGVVLLFGLAAWAAHALPRRALVDPPEEAPTLETFVDSLAALYARSDDRARVLERYRELTLGRLRRALGLAADLPRAALLERIRRHPRVDDARYQLLVSADPNPSQARVRSVARRLDRLVYEVTR